MKKIFTAFLTVVIVLIMTVPALAAGSAQMSISASKNTATPGQSVDFTVTVSSVDDCRSGGIVISYDQTVFEYVGGKCLVGGTTMSDFSGGTGVFAFSEGTGVSGSIFRFTLKVRADAPIGAGWVSGKPSVRTGSGELSCGISGVSITVGCDHAFGSWTDAGSSHQRVCTKCGNTESVVHNWNTGTVTKAATCRQSGSATYTCTGCGARKTAVIDKSSEHTYDHGCDNGCNVCGLTRQSVHTYQNTWFTDETSHWRVCAVCAAKDTPVPHDFENSDATACRTCGYRREISHSYGLQWLADSSGHWQKCQQCDGVSAAIPHTPGPEATEDTAQICTVCAYEITPAQGHSFARDWSCDEVNHWHACDCGATADQTPHTWDAGMKNKDRSVTYTCTECAAQQTQKLQSLSTTELTVLIVSLIGICGGLTAWIIWRKKR